MSTHVCLSSEPRPRCSGRQPRSINSCLVTHDEAQALPLTMAGGCAVVRLEMILPLVDLGERQVVTRLDAQTSSHLASPVRPTKMPALEHAGLLGGQDVKFLRRGACPQAFDRSSSGDRQECWPLWESNPAASPSLPQRATAERSECFELTTSAPGFEPATDCRRLDRCHRNWVV